MSQPPHDPETAILHTPAILIIDGDAHMLSVCTCHLEKAGYRVLSASSSAEGLHTCHTYPGKIDLVVLDLRLPRLPQPGRRLSSCRLYGEKLFEQIRLTRSGSRFLVTSAVAPSSLHTRGLGWLVRQVPFLPKPFDPTMFVTKVRDVLHQPLPGALRAHMPWRHIG